nr:vesicle transport through interaction with t-SNAREs homolog 1A-like [Cherax quadricarinatus]
MPISEYAAPAWNPHLRKLVKKLEKVQRYATRLLLKTKCNEINPGTKLERMELEVRDLEPAQREKLGGRIKSYQVELKRLEGEYSRVKLSATTNEASMRAELLEDGYAGVSVGEEQRQSLLDNTETLERTSVRLSQGHKIALETEHIGAQILNDLYSQRQTISHAQERLRETDADLDQSSRVLNTMLRRVLQNRFILYAAFIAVGLVIALAVYFSVSRG